MSIVQRLPLERLSTPRGEAIRRYDLGAETIRELLRSTKVRFVIANVGHELRWVAEADCFDFWKREVQPHLAESNGRIQLEQFPREYAYFASQWDDGAAPIIL
ncbi:MAG TPA: hypothetical protein VGI81_17890, partial [Tepidisphaeraceae bacterium]